MLPTTKDQHPLMRRVKTLFLFILKIHTHTLQLTSYGTARTVHMEHWKESQLFMDAKDFLRESPLLSIAQFLGHQRRLMVSV